MHTESRPFSPLTRAENLAQLASEPFDLLVIGGGITGVAIARDAALRGIKTALVEKDDWAAGTSSRSARLIHGGLRYLEYYQFGLVFEALSERAVLRKIAPRLVRPLPFIYPLYRGQEPGFLKLMAGMWLYDFLAQFRNVSRHRMMLARETARREPIVAREGLRGAARYYDAVVDDARLTLATVQSAHLAGAVVANHARAVRLMRTRADGHTVGAGVLDEITGREIEIRARVVVNACGPWVDSMRSMDAGARSASPLLRPTKGVHLLIRRERLTSQHAIAFDSPRDYRHLYVIPWGDFAIIGTTDTDYTGDPDAPSVTPDDADYLLEAARHAFPSVRLDESDVISAYSGLRALISSDAVGTYAISREHHIEESNSGLFTIAGGKLTTHRLMAREMVDTIAKKVGSAGKCVTGKQHIETAERDRAGISIPACDEAAIPVAAYAHLVEAYGTDAIRPLAYIEERPDLGQPVTPGLPYLRAEVHYAVQHEMALSLPDVLIRRTHVIYETPNAGLPQAREVAALMAEKLGWDGAELERQVAEYKRQVALTRSFRKL